jgi:N-acetylglucosamine-6-sulfatase
MRRRAVLILTTVVIGGVLVLSWSSPANLPATAPQPLPPNFVFILTDDMRKDDLKYMPETNSLLANQGMSFTNAFVPTALCCPSRATILRGQYAHNSGVWTNVNSPSGGWEGYQSRGYEQDNVATHLDTAGYRTGLFGKYLNHYEGTTVPPGWDDWFAMVHNGKYLNYDVNDNGIIKHYGTSSSDYSTDVLSAQTREFIDASVGAGEPFFAYVAPKAPHGGFSPVPGHEHDFDGEKAPRLPSFNELDVSDKPPWIRSLPRLKITQIANLDNRHEERVESLQALDDLVTAVVTKLDQAGVLENTYIVFSSDNGFHHGEHRIPKGKARPYEEDIRMLLLIRGPGVGAASTTHKLALNTDFLPTFTDLAGAPTPSYVDGRSLRPILTGSATTWRTAILLEGRKGGDPKVPVARNYYGIRTSTGKYVEYEGGFRELYNLSTDPYELTNSYRATTPPANLAARLEDLKGCAGATCRTAEDGP